MAVTDADYMETGDAANPQAQAGRYSLGKCASEVYDTFQKRREAVLEKGRVMADLTIPSLIPPRGWLVGDKLPGNNQSLGARCVNNLAAKLMFMAFPPNQPVMKLQPIEYKLQAEINQDPEMWGQIELSLGRLAEEHRTRLTTTTVLSAYELAMKHLIVGGNCLWKHTNIDNPTVWDVRHYICMRASDGQPLLSIHKECVSVETLAPDIKDVVYQASPEVKLKNQWEQEVDIYSVCRLVVDGSTKDAKHWEYWQEYKGKLIEGTEVETDYDDPPMIPLWFIPVYGQHWGLSFCEEYRGDLFSSEALASAVNDGAALAALSLLFVDPAGRSSLKQIREARNLSVFSGKAVDLSVFRADKGADLNAASTREETIEKRLSGIFLLDFVIQRDGERVTAEEIKRLGAALDQALGGRYSELAQRTQRPIIMRFMRLNEEENPDLPKVPQDMVRVQVITGIDALGDSKEVQDLEDVGTFISKTFPTQAQNILDGPGFATRYAAAKGVKPDGIINTQQQIDAKQQQDQQQAQRQTMMEQTAGPIADGAMKGLVQNGLPQAPQQQQQPQGAPPSGAPNVS